MDPSGGIEVNYFDFRHKPFAVENYGLLINVNMKKLGFILVKVCNTIMEKTNNQFLVGSSKQLNIELKTSFVFCL